jgi:transcriptional regulator with XRE-family HTH domain
MDLKLKRKELGLTGSLAANILGISQSYLSHIENGRRKIDPDLISRIAQLYNASYEEVKKVAEESKDNAKASGNWITQIRIKQEPLHRAFLRELKYNPLNNLDDKEELIYRLVTFIDKNISHSIRDELGQNQKLLYTFIKKLL